MRISKAFIGLGAGLAVTVSGASAFTNTRAVAATRSTCSSRGPFLAFATTSGSVSSDVVSKAKKQVLSLASNIKADSKTGVFIADPAVKSDLKKAVADLEAVWGNPTERSKQLMIGDWTLLCTTNSAGGKGQEEKKAPKLPFKLPELPFQDKITKSIEVTQRIRSSDDSQEGKDKTIDRVDNVIEFTPFADTIGDLLGDNTPFAALKDLTVNPLEVSKSKISLIHKAEVQSIVPVLRTKISLQSYVLTVAGTSQYLEAEGADLLGLNVPLGEFQSGAFDTTYVDEELRISRGKVGLVDVLRVFVRKGMDAEIEAMIDTDLVAGSSDDDSEPSKIEEVMDAVEGVADAVKKVNEDVRDAIKSDIESVRDSVDSVADAIKDASEDVRDIVEEDMKDVVEAVEEVADVVVGKENREMIENEIKGEIKNVQETVEDVEESLKEIQDAVGASKSEDDDVDADADVDAQEENEEDNDEGDDEKKV